MKKKSFADLPPDFIHENFSVIALFWCGSLFGRCRRTFRYAWFSSFSLTIEFDLPKIATVYQGCYLFHRLDHKALR